VEYGVFAVDRPVVTLDDLDGPPLWERDAPAPLLLASLVGPGTRVLDEDAADPTLIVLAALLDGEAGTLRSGDVAARCAELNGVQLAKPSEWTVPDVLIDRGADSDVEAPIVLCMRQCRHDSKVRLDVVGDAVVIDGPPRSGVHLCVDRERADVTAQAVSAAAHAFAVRQVDPWADRAHRAALGAVQQARQETRSSAAMAQEKAQRAFDQMQQALDELRAVRASRSWRYTAVLRGRGIR
jgi:hypothetical protein